MKKNLPLATAKTIASGKKRTLCFKALGHGGLVHRRFDHRKTIHRLAGLDDTDEVKDRQDEPDNATGKRRGNVSARRSERGDKADAGNDDADDAENESGGVLAVGLRCFDADNADSEASRV